MPIRASGILEIGLTFSMWTTELSTQWSVFSTKIKQGSQVNSNYTDVVGWHKALSNLYKGSVLKYSRETGSR